MKTRIKIISLILVVSLLFLSGCKITFNENEEIFPLIESYYDVNPKPVKELPKKVEGYNIGKINDNTTYDSLTHMLEVARPTVLEVYGYDGKIEDGHKSAGSGVFIANITLDNKVYYYILTCYHVIKNMTSYFVKDIYSNKFNASLVGCDVSSDIAVLKICPELDGYDLTNKTSENYVNILLAKVRINNDGESPLLIGESVYAIGNPLGTLGGTVTQGIISSADREILVEGKKMTLIQTDCAINPGNSGGGLFDVNGNLVGIVNAGYRGEVEGLNFAISTDTAFKYADSIIKCGYIEGKGNINVSVGESVNNYQDISVIEYNRYNKNFVVITSLTEYYYNFGLRVNDIIVSVTYKGEEYKIQASSTRNEDEEYISPVQSFIDYMLYLDCSVGEEITFTVVHNGDSVKTDITVNLKQFVY